MTLETISGKIPSEKTVRTVSMIMDLLWRQSIRESAEAPHRKILDSDNFFSEKLHNIRYGVFRLISNLISEIAYGDLLHQNTEKNTDSERTFKKKLEPGGVMRKLLLIFSFLSLFLFLNNLFAYECVVEKIIDGDTFVCSGEKVRLTGVDTPESSINPHMEKQRSLGDTQTILHYGKLAREFVKKVMPAGTRVRLEFDVQQRDRYGRLLAYVWLPDGRMLNEIVLKEGYAMLYTVPPNVKYEERLRKAYREAVEGRKGLWR